MKRKKIISGKITLWSLSFSSGMRAYVAVGSKAQCWEYDRETDQWGQKTSHPTSRIEGITFSINGKG